jgi:hypothetical protein
MPTENFNKSTENTTEKSLSEKIDELLNEMDFLLNDLDKLQIEMFTTVKLSNSKNRGDQIDAEDTSTDDLRQQEIVKKQMRIQEISKEIRELNL